MSEPIRIVRRMDREAKAAAKRAAAEAKRAASGKPARKKRRKARKSAAAPACKYKVRTKGLKKAKCFKKAKSATSAAKSYVRKGKPSASVSGPVGKRKKVKVIKVCRKAKTSSKPVCQSKVKRRKSSGGTRRRRVTLPAVADRSPGPWADQYVFGS